MNTLTTTLAVANMFNFALAGLFLFQLGILSTSGYKVLSLKVIIPFLSFIEAAQTVVIAYVGLMAGLGSLESHAFIRVYSTIRMWNLPAAGATYGFFALQMYWLTHQWIIPAVTILLVCVQAVGDILNLIGTLRVGPLTDLAPEGRMAVVGAMLSTIGACVCGLYTMIMMVVIVRALSKGPGGPEVRKCIIALQRVAMQSHIPGIVVSLIDLIACLLFPRSHVSMIMAIIVGKVWSIALLRSLNSRGDVRRILCSHESSMGALGDLVSELVFAERGADMELEEMGTSSRDVDTSSYHVEQDITSGQSSPDDWSHRGAVGHHDSFVRFGESKKNYRGRGYHKRRSSAPL